MKQIILSFIVMITFTAARADDGRPNSAVKRNFNSLFGQVTSVNWFSEKSTYNAVFYMNSVKVVANFSDKGELQSSIRYYKENVLPMNLHKSLAKHYKGLSIFGVTEVTAAESTVYFVKMQDEKRWYTVKIDANQDFEIVEKYRKI